MLWKLPVVLLCFVLGVGFGFFVFVGRGLQDQQLIEHWREVVRFKESGKGQ